MKQIIRLFSIVSFLTLGFTSFAQGQPDWTKGTGFKGLVYSDLIVRSAVANTYDGAEKLAVEKVKQDANSHNFIIVDTYSRKTGNSWIVYVLAQISRVNGLNISEPLEKTNRYNLIGESFVPGMAQIKKGQIAKGSLFIASEVICVSGLIISECQRNNNSSKIKDTRDPILMKQYKNKSNNWATTRNIFIGGAAALYLWNVIDGIVAKGKTQIRGANGEIIAFSPYYCPSSLSNSDSFGIALNIMW